MNLEQKEKIDNFIKQGIESGATILTSKENDWHKNTNSLSILPTIFHNVDMNSSIVNEEIFGPVLTVIGFDTIKEAISIANNTNYGLAASIWTNDLDEAYYVSRELKAGIVHINSYGEDDNSVQFGGVKESGIGKDKSIFAFDEYSNLKTTWMKFNKL